jgi:transposase
MKIIPVSINLLSDWTTLFLTHWFEWLCSLQYEWRRPGKLESEKETILQHLEETTVSTLAELKKWIEEHLGIFVQTSWLSVWCKKNKIILTKRQKDFQENSNQKISKNLL